MFGCIYGCAKYWTSFVLMLNMKLRSSSTKICLPAAPRLNNSSHVSPHKIKQPTDKSSNKSAAFSWLFSLFLSSCVQYIHIFNCKYFIIVCYCPCGNLRVIGNTGGFLAIALNIFTFVAELRRSLLITRRLHGSPGGRQPICKQLNSWTDWWKLADNCQHIAINWSQSHRVSLR